MAFNISLSSDDDNNADILIGMGKYTQEHVHALNRALTTFSVTHPNIKYPIKAQSLEHARPGIKINPVIKFSTDESVLKTIAELRGFRRRQNGFSVKFGHGSRTENKGVKFERYTFDVIYEWLKTGTILDKELIDVVSSLARSRNSRIVSVEYTGNKHVKRPIDQSKTDVGPIGPTIADIILHLASGECLYLSLKFGNTVTFGNFGIAKLLPESTIAERKTPEIRAQRLLSTFGIFQHYYYDKFCDTYNNYVPGNRNRTTSSSKFLHRVEMDEPEKRDLINFLKFGIGYGYIILHSKNGKYETRTMTKESLDALVKVSHVDVEYITDGSAKRVNIKIPLNGLFVSASFRNKKADYSYPTHILLDYKFL